ncbi:MAG TPA: FAD-dependent oxidoreductase, partial [Pseudonocardiaceae bacterium]|nr:FAD-dependent oxidoreductase [Pseudonocardiaceae bacterium]
AAGVRDLELRRGDLACTLYEAGKDMAEYRFGDSIRAIAQDDAGVDVEFEHAPPERFDVVIGADGQHSRVRSLAFGPEARFARSLGYYVGGAAVDPSHGTADRPVMYNTPGRAAGVYRFGADAAAIFLFRRVEPIHYDHRDTEEHKRIVAAEFAHEDGWVVPRLLAEVLATDDFYFDSLSQIRMPGWSRGRVALAGDAGYGPALLSGSGTTLAMVGAYLLAGELANGDHVGAFARYEAAHRALVERSQRSAGTGGGFLVPRTPGAIRRRDMLARMARTHLVGARLSRYLPRRRIRLAEYPAVTFTPSA